MSCELPLKIKFSHTTLYGRIYYIVNSMENGQHTMVWRRFEHAKYITIHVLVA